MKPRGLNSLLSKQSGNKNLSGSTKPDPSAMRLGALGGAAGAADADKKDQGKVTRGKPAKGYKPSSTAAKSTPAALRRTAPGA